MIRKVTNQNISILTLICSVCLLTARYQNAATARLRQVLKRSPWANTRRHVINHQQLAAARMAQRGVAALDKVWSFTGEPRSKEEPLGHAKIYAILIAMSVRILCSG
jgi:hypothetical protein